MLVDRRFFPTFNDSLFVYRDLHVFHKCNVASDPKSIKVLMLVFKVFVFLCVPSSVIIEDFCESKFKGVLSVVHL